MEWSWALSDLQNLPPQDEEMTDFDKLIRSLLIPALPRNPRVMADRIDAPT